MSGGSSKPKDVPVSQGEKIQTQLARDQISYYRSTFAPLETQFRDEASRDYSERLAGQNATSSMREMTPGLADVAMSGMSMDTASLAGATTAGRVAGTAQGKREQADGRLESLGVGMGITADANRTLSEAGRLQTNAAIDQTREKVAEMQAKAGVRNAALGAVAAVGGAYGTKSYLDSRDAKAAAAESSRLGASRAGYSPAFLSGWTGPIGR